MQNIYINWFLASFTDLHRLYLEIMSQVVFMILLLLMTLFFSEAMCQMYSFDFTELKYWLCILYSDGCSTAKEKVKIMNRCPSKEFIQWINCF